MPTLDNEREPKKLSTVINYIAAGVLLLVIVAFVAITIFNSNNKTQATTQEDKTLNIADGTNVAILTVRQAIAQSELDGTGEITSMECDTLSRAARNFDSNSRWFASCDYSLYGSMPDTDSESIVKLSDGDYCATFVTDTDVKVLTDYTFTEGECGDSRISIQQPSS
jgi:hypothetical protein